MQWVAQSQIYKIVNVPSRTIRTNILQAIRQGLGFVRENAERKSSRDPQYLIELDGFCEYAQQKGWKVKANTAVVTSQPAQPLIAWQSEVRTTAQAAAEKGRCAATFADGASLVSSYIRKGRLYLVCVDEKYNAIRESENARLRKRCAELEAENARLREQIETQQLEFSFDRPAGPDSDVDIVAVEEGNHAQI